MEYDKQHSRDYQCEDQHFAHTFASLLRMIKNIIMRAFFGSIPVSGRYYVGNVPLDCGTTKSVLERSMGKREIQLDGETLWFNGLTGQVAGEKKWSETHISGGGGGGHVSNGYGFSAPVHVSSRVVTRHEFWLVSPDGQETCITNSTTAVNVREGQWMTVIWGASKKKGNGPYLLIRNHNLNLPQNIRLNTNCSNLLKQMGVSDPAKAVWLALIPLVLLLAFTSWIVVFFISILLVFPLAIAVGKLRLKKWNKVMAAAGEVMELEIKDSQRRVALQAQSQHRIAR